MTTCSSIAINDVLFPTDFSAESMQAIEHVRRLQRHYDANVHVLHVLDLFPYSLSADTTAVAKSEEMRQRGLAQMEKFTRSQRLDGPKYESAVVTGDVASGVEDFARHHNVDLIVLGSRADVGLNRLFQGSMAEEIFRTASCPVMVIGPQADSTEKERGFRHLLFATDLSATSQAAIPYVEFFLKQEPESQVTLAHFLDHDPGAPYERHETRRRASQALTNLIDPSLRKQIGEVAVEFCSAEKGITDMARGLGADLLVLGVRQGGSFTRAATHGLFSIAHRVIAHTPCPVLTIRAATKEA